MQINIDKTEQAAVLLIEGRIDGASSPAVRDKLAQLIAEGNNVLVVDGALLTYISSAGLRVFYQALAKLEENANGGKIVFCRLREEIERVFHMVNMASDFPVFATREAALESLK